MPLLPLSPPPGMVRNGTELQTQGRWRDGNLVRWNEGVLQPVKGWSKRAQLPAGAPMRGAQAWKDNSGDRWLGFGSADKLYAVSAGSVITDITPVGLVAGRIDGLSNEGYGGSFYGLGAYGTERTGETPIRPATTWSLTSWGERLVGCSDMDRKIYEWTPGTPTALPVANAPTAVALIANEERFLLALGAAGNPRLVMWCDRENNTVWTPTTLNEAGDYELQTAGEIMCAEQARGQVLILTDQDAHTATYIGPPFVFSIERVGMACGIISRHASATVDAGTFWMGRRGFYTFSGGRVEPLACDVEDALFADFNRSQASKIWCAANASYSEIWWFYPSSGSTECDSYAAFNYAEGHWTTGKLARTTGVDLGVPRFVTWLAADNAIYSHETGLDYAGDVPWIESAPVSLGNGDQVLSAVSLMPDELTQGDVSMSFTTRFHPNSEKRTYGPYSMRAPTSVRFTGRQVVLRITGARLADWRVGIPKLDVRPGGLR